MIKLVKMYLVIFFLFFSATGQAGEILVGFSGPLSGIAAEYGQDVVSGIELAIKEINSAGGIVVGKKKYNVVLEKLDDRIDPTQAVNNARRLKSKGAIAVFNPVFNTISAIARINEEKKNELLLLAFTSTPAASELGNKLMVIAPGSFTHLAEVYARWAHSKGWKKCAMVVTLGAYGDEWRHVFRKKWEEMGGTITADQPANYYTETDYSAQLTAAIASKPDCMLIGGPSVTTALAIEQARMLGYKGPFLLIDQAKLDVISQQLGGTTLIGNAIATAAITSLPPHPEQKFGTKYREMFNKPATWEAACNYTFMHALAKAVEKAQTIKDVFKVREAFPQIMPLLNDRFPMEFLGMTPQGRVHVFTSTQTVTDGRLDTPIMYAWWPRTQEEFEGVLKITKTHRSIVKKWIKAPI
ncbi:MAG: ABC transporter substrate-binding protein [Syntrophales bacterium]|nr:ABC transporter substrate-binding protein [Syntrophales bacterium]